MTTGNEIQRLKKDINISFSALYPALREKEGRWYSDDEVKALPAIRADHVYKDEWDIRKVSMTKLINYLKLKAQALSILEVGCGNGWLCNQLSSIPDVNITGIDINNEELLQAKRLFGTKLQINFEYGEIGSDILTGRKFNIVVFAASIQYFPSLKEGVMKAFTLMEDNGEVHILDSAFYKDEEVDGARQRSADYFEDIGFPQMAMHYFHRTYSELDSFKYNILYDPRSLVNRILQKKNPFPWIRVRKK